MSSTKHKEVKASTTAKNKASNKITSVMLNRAKALSKLPKAVLILIFGGLLAAIYAANQDFGIGTAVLYMFADNGLQSGRTGGNVKMRNGRARAFKVPANPQTPAQSSARNAFGTISSAFKSLSADAMATWNNAVGFFTSDRFARPVALVGKALYNSLNGNLVDVGIGTLTNAPLPGSVESVVIDAVTADASASTVSMALTDAAIPANTSIKIFATAQQSSGRSRVGKSAYRLLATAPAAATSPIALGSEYEAKFGDLTTGGKIFFKIVPVNETTGQAGVASLVSTTVVA